MIDSRINIQLFFLFLLTKRKEGPTLRFNETQNRCFLYNLAWLLGEVASPIEKNIIRQNKNLRRWMQMRERKSDYEEIR